MFGDRDFERGKLADLGLGDARHDRPVDDAHGKMPNEIDDARMRPFVPRTHELVQKPSTFGPTPLSERTVAKSGASLAGRMVFRANVH